MKRAYHAMPSGFTLCTADSHCAPQLSLGVQRSQSSGDVHHDLTPAALADAAGADKLPDAAIATEDVMSQAAQHGSDDEDELVKLQITIGLAARKSVVIKVDADASVGQIKARLKQVVDVDSTVDWSKLDFSKLDLIIGRGTEKVNLSKDFDYDKIMNTRRIKDIVKSNREGDCVPCSLVGLEVDNMLIMMERNRPETERHAVVSGRWAHGP
jgi:hypothetical protein